MHVLRYKCVEPWSANESQATNPIRFLTASVFPNVRPLANSRHHVAGPDRGCVGGTHAGGAAAGDKPRHARRTASGDQGQWQIHVSADATGGLRADSCLSSRYAVL